MDPLDEAVVDAAAERYVAHWRHDSAKNDRTGSKAAYEGESADDVLRAHGIEYDADPRLWGRYAHAAIRRAITKLPPKSWQHRRSRRAKWVTGEYVEGSR